MHRSTLDVFRRHALAIAVVAGAIGAVTAEARAETFAPPCPTTGYELSLVAPSYDLPVEGTFVFEVFAYGDATAEQALAYTTVVATDDGGADVLGTLSLEDDDLGMPEPHATLVWRADTVPLAEGTTLTLVVRIDNASAAGLGCAAPMMDVEQTVEGRVGTGPTPPPATPSVSVTAELSAGCCLGDGCSGEYVTVTVMGSVPEESFPGEIAWELLHVAPSGEVLATATSVRPRSSAMRYFAPRLASLDEEFCGQVVATSRATGESSTSDVACTTLARTPPVCDVEEMEMEMEMGMEAETTSSDEDCSCAVRRGGSVPGGWPLAAVVLLGLVALRIRR